MGFGLRIFLPCSCSLGVLGGIAFSGGLLALFFLGLSRLGSFCLAWSFLLSLWQILACMVRLSCWNVLVPFLLFGVLALSCALVSWLGCFSSCAALLFGFDFVVDSMAVLGGHRFRLRSSLVLLGHFSGSFSLSLGSVLRFLCSSWWAREFVSSSWLASRAWLYALGCSLLVGLSLLLLALVKLSVLLLAALPFPCRCLWVLVGRSGSRCVVGWNGGQGNSCAVFLGWLLVLDCTVLGC